MAVRPLVNIERLTTAHVNSVDGSMTYESGVAYKANTTVSYNGSLYTANVDIEDTDTDTPDAAPDRWSLTINASEVGTSGDISALAARVSALEDTVGDETDGLVKDVDDLQNIEIVNGVKNYLPNVGNTIETNGITFTKNSDGSVTANGTATTNATYRMIGSDITKPLTLPTNKYIISGCPDDASDEKYWMVFSWTGKPTSYVYDSPVEVEVGPSNPTNAGIVIKSGVTVDNVTFYPMIRLASDTDNSYVPYAMSNRELTEKFDIITDTSNTGITAVKSGNVVNVTFNGTFSITQNVYSIVGTLPNGMRPTNEITAILSTTESTPRLVQVRVPTDGVVQINGWQLSGDILLQGLLTFITNS